MLATIGLLAPASVPQDESTATVEPGNLRGIWRIVGGENDGKSWERPKDEHPEDAKVVITKDKIIMKWACCSREGTIELTYQLGPDRAMDVSLPDRTSQKAFYLLQNDTLKIYFGPNGKKRADRFATRDTERTVIILKVVSREWAGPRR